MKNNNNSYYMPQLPAWALAQEEEAILMREQIEKNKKEQEKLNKKINEPIDINDMVTRLTAGDPSAADNTKFFCSKNFSDADGVRLCTAAEKNPHVEFLNFYVNRLGDPAALIIARIMTHSKKLMGVDLSDNALGKKGVQAICLALFEAKNLKALDLKGGPMSLEAALFLSGTLCQPSPLCMLNIWSPQFTDEMFEPIVKALELMPRQLLLVVNSQQLSQTLIKRAQQISGLNLRLEANPLIHDLNQLETGLAQIGQNLTELFNNPVVAEMLEDALKDQPENLKNYVRSQQDQLKNFNFRK